MTKTVLLIDCDGVISPLSAVPIKSLISAVQTIAKQWKFTEKQYQDANKEVRGNGIGEIGLFNAIYKLVDKDITKYEAFCKDVFDILDYSKLKPNPKLYQLLEEASHYYDLYIATNNHHIHIKNVIQKIFGKDIDCDNLFFNVIDITMTLRDNCFHPKQSIDGLKIYTSLAKAEVKNCILIDDSEQNIERADQIRMRSYHVTSYYPIERCLYELISEAKQAKQ